MLYIRARKKKLIPLIERDSVFPFFVESLSSQRIYIFEKKSDDDETRCVWPIVRGGGIYIATREPCNARCIYVPAVKGCDNERCKSRRHCESFDGGISSSPMIAARDDLR